VDGDTRAASASGASDTSTVSRYFTSTDLRFKENVQNQQSSTHLRAHRQIDRISFDNVGGFDPAVLAGIALVAVRASG